MWKFSGGQNQASTTGVIDPLELSRLTSDIEQAGELAPPPVAILLRFTDPDLISLPEDVADANALRAGIGIAQAVEEDCTRVTFVVILLAR